MNGSRQLITGMVYRGRIIGVFFPLIFFCKCVYDPMDLRLQLYNNSNREILICADGSGSIKYNIDFSFFINIMKEHHKNPEFPLPETILPLKQGKSPLKPRERKDNEIISFYCADFDSLYNFSKQNREVEEFNDYTIFYFTIKQLDSLDWKVTIDSDSFVPKGATIVKSLPVE